MLSAVDFINQWGLAAIGFCLILGLFTRSAAFAGMLLVLLYYFAYPPFIGYENPLPAEGNYLVVNKNLIEAAALLVLALFPTGRALGLDGVPFRKGKSVEN